MPGPLTTAAAERREADDFFAVVFFLSGFLATVFLVLVFFFAAFLATLFLETVFFACFFFLLDLAVVERFLLVAVFWVAIAFDVSLIRAAGHAGGGIVHTDCPRAMPDSITFS